MRHFRPCLALRSPSPLISFFIGAFILSVPANASQYKPLDQVSASDLARLEMKKFAQQNETDEADQSSAEGTTEALSDLDKRDEPANFRSPEFKTYLDSISSFVERDGNSIRLLDTGDQHWQKIIEIIHRADRFVNLSYLQFTKDEVGYAVTATLIAKKLRIDEFMTADNYKSITDFGLEESDLTVAPAANRGSRGDTVVARFLRAPGSPEEIVGRALTADRPSGHVVGTGIDDLLNWYVSERMRNEQASSELISTTLSNSTLFQQKLDGYLSGSVQVRILLDFLNTGFKLPNSEPHSLIGAMKKVGIEARYAPNLLFWISDHFKTTTSDHESVISGGNIIDKVMELDPSHITFRDSAFAVQGPLVSDINNFFMKRYYSKNDYSAILASEGEASYRYVVDPKHAIDPLAVVANARLAATLPFHSIDTFRTFLASVRGAQHSFITEMGFFSDPLVAVVLAKKAKAMHIREAKAAAGENWKLSTCDPAVFGQRDHVVVILPKYGDQFVSNIALTGIVPLMMSAGVDVCNWKGELANEVTRKPGNPARTYARKAMMHTKLWIADDSIAYLGSANLTHRSLWTDYELGMLTTDAGFIQQMREKIVDIDLASSEPQKYHLWARFVSIASWVLNWGTWLE